MGKARVEGRERRRFDSGKAHFGTDVLPVEEPLTVRLAGEPLVTTMRTPGSDHALVAGFLLAEGLIQGPADIGAMIHCGDGEAQAAEHTLEVRPGPGFTFRLEDARRGNLSTSSCGVCGREQIEDLLGRIRPLSASRVFVSEEIRSALETLHSQQGLFAQTGSIHSAALFDEALNLLAFDEDVGRHNAIDKVVGRVLLDRRLTDASLLALSGRVSFEVVQKAAAAGISTLVTKKGLTTMAADLAKAASVRVCAFVRGTRLSFYGGGVHQGANGPE